MSFTIFLLDVRFPQGLKEKKMRIRVGQDCFNIAWLKYQRNKKKQNEMNEK